MKPAVPNGFRVRSPGLNDAAAVQELICACDIADYGAPDCSVEDVYADWRRHGFVLDRDAWLVYAPDGTLAAYGNAYDTSVYIRFDQSCVHPAFRGQGLEEFLLDRAEEYARESNGSMTLQWMVNIEHAETRARFVQYGYQITRHDYVMEIALRERPPAPLLPASLTMRSFVRGQDEQSVWACIQEAFRDTRGHFDLPYNAWAKGFMEHADWSPELSPVVTQGDEVVAAAMVFNFSNGGWIRQLGVRRPWRKQGVGLALLHQVFGEFFERGTGTVGLGVDAYSLTGATRLYERAGMQVKNHFVRYEKEIT